MRVALSLCTALLGISPSTAHAAEAILPVTINIVQCGTISQIESMCETDRRCCVFLGKTQGQKLDDPLSRQVHANKKSNPRPPTAALQEPNNLSAVGGLNTIRR